MRLLLLVLGLISVQSAWGDYELRYFSRNRDTVVQYATVYWDVPARPENTPATETFLVFAWCGDSEVTCNRAHQGKTLIKKIAHAKYIEVQAAALGVSLKYVRTREGMNRLERDLKAAKDANQTEFVASLERQKAAATRLRELMWPMSIENDADIAQGTDTFRLLLGGFTGVPEINARDTDTPKRHLDLTTFHDWILASATAATYGEATQACRGMGGVVPTQEDYAKLAPWIESTPLSTWVTSFWLAQPSFHSRYEQVREPQGENSYILRSVQRGVLSIPRVEFTGRKGTVISKEEIVFTRDLQSRTASNDAADRAAALENMTTKLPVICLAPATIPRS